MGRRLGLIVIAMALASCGASAARSSSTGAVAASPSCPPAHAHTIAASRGAQVYSLGGVVYGCSDRTHKLTRLGSAGACIRANRIGPVKVAGQITAYGVQSCGIDTGSGQLVVRRLSDGRVVHREQAISGFLGPESFSSVSAVVVKANGSAAWIATGSSIVRHSKSVEVHKVASGAAVLLDSGAAIAPRSLRLRRSRITWIDGGAMRSAALH